jgi:hypothetical protein
MDRLSLDALSGLADTKNYKLRIESIHDEHEDDARLRRFKEKWLFIATLIIITLAFLGGGYFIFTRTNSPYLSQVITGEVGLVMALSGYYVRGKL